MVLWKKIWLIHNRTNILPTHRYLHVVFPDFGGPIIAICIVTIGLGEGCFKNFIGQLMKADLAFSDDM
jgi:hypothetical protein